PVLPLAPAGLTPVSGTAVDIRRHRRRGWKGLSSLALQPGPPRASLSQQEEHVKFIAPAVAAVAIAGLVSAPAPASAATCDAPIRAAADHWIAGHAKPADATWFNALFIKGDIEAYRLTSDPKYLKFATDW